MRMWLWVVLSAVMFAAGWNVNGWRHDAAVSIAVQDRTVEFNERQRQWDTERAMLEREKAALHIEFSALQEAANHESVPTGAACHFSDHWVRMWNAGSAGRMRTGATPDVTGRGHDPAAGGVAVVARWSPGVDPARAFGGG